MGALTPETCTVTLQWNKSYCILLHLVGLLCNMDYDARDHEFKIHLCSSLYIIILAFYANLSLELLTLSLNRSFVKRNWKEILLYLYRARNKITQLSIPTHVQLQRHRLKFIKNHLKKTPTCFCLRPSSGSYNVLAKIIIIIDHSWMFLC